MKHKIIFIFSVAIFIMYSVFLRAMTKENIDSEQAIAMLYSIEDAFKRIQLKPPPEVEEKLGALKMAIEAKKPLELSKREELQLLIGRNLLDVEALMNELKDGKLASSDLPIDALISYSTKPLRPSDYRFADRMKATLINWLLWRSDDPYFYQLLTDSPISEALCSKVNLRPRDLSFSPLMCALMCTCNNKEKVIKFLLDCGADPNMASADGHFPLTIAVEFCGFSVVKSLLDAGANANYRETSSKNIVNTAAEQNNEN